MLKYLAAFFIGLLPALAQAQPVCSTVNTPACQSQAQNPGPLDVVLGQQLNGPQLPNQTVKMSLAQVLSSAPLNTVGLTLTDNGAIKMAAGQQQWWDASGTHASAYNSGLSALTYLVSGSPVFAISDTGYLSLANASNLNVTVSGTTSSLATALSHAASGTPAGSNGQYQFNNAGVFGGTSTIPNTAITGLGTASTANTGTSGATVPFLNGVNTFSGVGTFSAGLFSQAVDNTLYCDQYGTGSTGLAACVAAAPAGGNTKLMLPPNTTIGMTALVTVTKPNITIECPSWGTIIQRQTNITTPILSMNGAGDATLNCTIDGNYSTYGSSGISGDVTMAATNGLFYKNQIINPSGSVALALSGTNSRASYNTIVGSSQTTFSAGYGIWAINHVPVIIDHNTISNTGTDGIGFDGAGSIVSNNHLFGNHCYTGIGGGQLVQYYTGTLGATSINEVIANNTIDQGCNTGTLANNLSGGLELYGPNLVVSNNTINNQYGAGIGVGVNAVGVTLTGNVSRNSGQNGTNTGGIVIQNGATHITADSNYLIDDQGTPTQIYGIYDVSGAGDYMKFTNNHILGATTPINDPSPGANKIISGNMAVDNVIPSVATAATLTLPINPTVALTGSTTVTAISADVWVNRQITMIAGSAVSFTSGATIANSVYALAGTTIVANYDGTIWHLSTFATPHQDVQLFTSSGTWTKPAWCLAAGITCTVEVYGLGAGGGGGQGGQATLGTAVSGGGSGAGGTCYGTKPKLASDFTSTVSVTLGTPGVAGSGASSGTGNSGTAATATTFGSYFSWGGGGGGSGGSLTASAGGAAGGVTGNGSSASGATAGASVGASGVQGGGSGTGGTVSPYGTNNASGGGSSLTASSAGNAAPCLGAAGTGGSLTSGSAATAGGNGGAALGNVNFANGGANTGAAGTNAVGSDADNPTVNGPSGGGANTAGVGGAGGGAGTNAYGVGGAGGGAGTTAGGAGGTPGGALIKVITRG